jgi:hypothetical protein
VLTKRQSISLRVLVLWREIALLIIILKIILAFNVIQIVLLAKIHQIFHVFLVNLIHQKITFIKVNVYLFVHKTTIIKSQIIHASVNKMNFLFEKLIIFFLLFNIFLIKYIKKFYLIRMLPTMLKMFFILIMWDLFQYRLLDTENLELLY